MDVIGSQDNSGWQSPQDSSPASWTGQGQLWSDVVSQGFIQ